MAIKVPLDRFVSLKFASTNEDPDNYRRPLPYNDLRAHRRVPRKHAKMNNQSQYFIFESLFAYECWFGEQSNKLNNVLNN